MRFPMIPVRVLVGITVLACCYASTFRGTSFPTEVPEIPNASIEVTEVYVPPHLYPKGIPTGQPGLCLVHINTFIPNPNRLDDDRGTLEFVLAEEGKEDEEHVCYVPSSVSFQSFRLLKKNGPDAV